LAKQQFYADRSWKALFAEARASGLPTGEVDALENWIREERPNQKRDDALALLERIAHDSKSGLRPFEADFTFEPTTFWDSAERAFANARTPDESAPS
jgi:hypothetical protein